MPSPRSAKRPAPRTERAELLANVAAMYYQEDMLQEAIARRVGVTRSMVSRLLSEARQRGIVEVRIHRPLQFDGDLAAELVSRFGMQEAHVVVVPEDGNERLLEKLGQAAAGVLKDFLAPNRILGVTWGTAIRAVVDALEGDAPFPLKVVQLGGAGQSRIRDYDGHALVQRVVQKLGGEAFYLNAPLIVENARTAELLLSHRAIRETIELGRQCDVAVLGVGSTDPRYSTLYHAGYFTLDELKNMIEAGAVGNVCGLHFNLRGEPTSPEFDRRLVSLRRQDLLGIPIRLGVAGGRGKARALLGALRGGYVNVLVTDNLLVGELLRLDKEAKPLTGRRVPRDGGARDVGSGIANRMPRRSRLPR